MVVGGAVTEGAVMDGTEVDEAGADEVPVGGTGGTDEIGVAFK